MLAPAGSERGLIGLQDAAYPTALLTVFAVGAVVVFLVRAVLAPLTSELFELVLHGHQHRSGTTHIALSLSGHSPQKNPLDCGLRCFRYLSVYASTPQPPFLQGVW